MATATKEPDALEQREIERLDTDEARAKRRAADMVRSLEDRKTIPAGLRAGMTSGDDEITAHFRRLAPECLEPWVRDQRPMTEDEIKGSRKVYKYGAAMQGFLGEAAKHRQYVNEGWIPVREPDRSHAVFGSMLTYKRPIEISRDAVQRAAVLSHKRIQAQNSEMQAAARESDSRITEDVASVVQETKKVVPQPVTA